MFKKYRLYPGIIILIITGLFLFKASISYACNGKDVMLSEDLELTDQNNSGYQLDEEGNLLFDESLINITPEHAREIAERFVTENLQPPPPPGIQET